MTATTVTYDVKLRVTLAMLPTLLQVIEKTKGVELVTVSTSAAPIVETRGYANGIKNKGITGVDLLLEILTASGGRCVKSHVEKKFMERGFSAQSVSPTVSRLIREQKIIRPTADTLQLNGET
jgi:hypothetical protein